MKRTPNTPKVECPKCLGCGRLDSKESRPWCQVTNPPNPEVRAGTVTPVECPECQGFGNVDVIEEKPAEAVAPAPKPSPTKTPAPVAEPKKT